jgi:hypothetical protein
LSLSEAEEIESAEVLPDPAWIGWSPISVLPLVTIACRSLLVPWVFMWILSFAESEWCAVRFGHL